jgi:hypothetical protein
VETKRVKKEIKMRKFILRLGIVVFLFVAVPFIPATNSILFALGDDSRPPAPAPPPPPPPPRGEKTMIEILIDLVLS